MTTRFNKQFGGISANIYSRIQKSDTLPKNINVVVRDHPELSKKYTQIPNKRWYSTIDNNIMFFFYG